MANHYSRCVSPNGEDPAGIEGRLATMTETSYYPPTSSPRQQVGTGTPGPVLVAFAGPAAQRRATVAIRFILAIPIAKRLMADTAGSEQDYRESTQATSFTSLVNISTAAEKVGGQFDNDYPALMRSLENVGVALGVQAGTLNNAATTLNREAAALNWRAAALNRRAAALNVTVSVRAANPGS
jgi:hypothetical protein